MINRQSLVGGEGGETFYDSVSESCRAQRSLNECTRSHLFGAAKIL
jgi:hypothetical protein